MKHSWWLCLAKQICGDPDPETGPCRAIQVQVEEPHLSRAGCSMLGRGLVPCWGAGGLRLMHCTRVVGEGLWSCRENIPSVSVMFVKHSGKIQISKFTPLNIFNFVIISLTIDALLRTLRSISLSRELGASWGSEGLWMRTHSGPTEHGVHCLGGS